jgi:hypothetical protein
MRSMHLKSEIAQLVTERSLSQIPCTLTVLPPERLSPAVSAAPDPSGYLRVSRYSSWIFEPPPVR